MGDVGRPFQGRRIGSRFANVHGGMSTPPRLSAECYQAFGRFFLTICTDRRRQTFASADCVSLARGELLRTLADYGFDATAYCFMLDHFHALVESTEPRCDFARFAAMFKQRSAFAHKRATGARLWQAGYFDRVLRRDEATPEVVAYIVDNPVRAGLSRDAREYPFIGSTRYSVTELLEAVAELRSRKWQP